MPFHLLAITERPSDEQFAESIAKAHGMGFQKAVTAEQAHSILLHQPQSIVFWDVDHPKAANTQDPLSAQNVGRMLMQTIPSERVFAFSDQPLNAQPYLFNVPAFGHHIFRREDKSGPEIYGRIATSCLAIDPFGLGRYLPAETPIQKIALKRSRERQIAMEAVNKVLLKKGIHTRVCATISQAVDELLMNAIFDAPLSPEFVSYRRPVARGSDFALNDKEVVTLEIASTPDYCAICVSDNFGSLEKEKVLGFIHKDYTSSQYKVREDTVGAGLGIYGMIQSGLSMLFISGPRKKTEVILFFPISKSYKDFKTSFRFFSFIMR